MLKEMIREVVPSIWPLIIFICIIAITLRVFFLLNHNRKFVLHKELFSLVFILYILCLYYILTDLNYAQGGINLIPFKEILRYSFGSEKFMTNVVGNIVIFVPFGIFASHYLDTKKLSTNVLVALIVSLCIEVMQYYLGRTFDIDDIILNIVGSFIGYLLYIATNAIKEKLPKFMKSDAFINFIVIIIIIAIILFSVRPNLLAI